ncbi:MAG TPA: acetyl-CoA hydrolase/transferase C-terminal domain-containing protein, partial [Dehalococcoidia bacterium]|nr:acetyl-CoA hydrolase/transferase C-terminal domain-containing protein [Dehalococcoidia bacterium]
MEGHFRHNSFFVGPADREAVRSGRADYVPVFLSEIPRLLRKQMPVDVALIHTSLPDEHGFLSLGAECVATLAALESAGTVVAQINEKMPRTLGNTFVHFSKVAKIVEVSEDILELKPDPPGPVEEGIGRFVAEMVEDGATLQAGIGGIPDAVLKHLRDRKDLGIHTEMVSDGVMDLMNAGVVTGARKTVHQGRAVATFLLGSRRLYDFANDNPAFEVHPVDHTNDPFVISQNSKMVSINSAIEVDLSGQVCSDSIGYRIYSGFGGQLDFVRGAARSEGGRPIIALPSTAEGETVSRIVPAQREGAGVVTTRADVHYVVTEYGTAYLHGKNLRERARSLIDIAHPKFREGLERAFAGRSHHAQ